MKRLLASPCAGLMAAALLLTGVLGYMIADRVRLLASGREIVLAIRPVDPRDLFKGDYARLGFDISQVGAALVPPLGRPEDRSRWLGETTVFVTLEQQGDEAWKPVAISQTLPTGLPGNRIALRGRLQSWGNRRIAYGIERYFVPEGTGGNIEQLARQSKLSAIVAVDKAGRAAIKGLVTDGKRIYEEPLF